MHCPAWLGKQPGVNSLFASSLSMPSERLVNVQSQLRRCLLLLLNSWRHRMCVSMGLMSEPCCANTTFYFTKRLRTQAPPLRCQQDCAKRDHITQAGPARQHAKPPPRLPTSSLHASRFNCAKHAGSQHTGWTARGKQKNTHNATQARMLPASPLLASHFDCAMQGGSQQPPPARETAACNATQSGPPAMRRNVRRLLQPSSGGPLVPGSAGFASCSA